MSLRAMTWALERSPAESAQERLILIALAERASPDGTASFPSQAELADRALCSDRTVRRHLKALEERGVIFKGDQQLVSHYRWDRRPVVWNLNLELERPDNMSSERPDNMSGRSQVTERPDTGGTNGRTQVSYKPKDKPTNKPLGLSEVSTSLADVDKPVEKRIPSLGFDPAQAREEGLDALYSRMGWTRPSKQPEIN